MIRLGAQGPLGTIVCLGAHPDDIEIGCGGALLELARSAADVHFVVATGSEDRAREAEESAHRLLDDVCPIHIHQARFADGFLPYEAESVKSFVREATRDLEPDIVFAPARHDLHQDHRYVGELALQLFRDQLILEYEIPKYDGDLIPPNFYFPLSKSTMDAKVDHLLASFPSQHEKPWYRPEVFRSLAILRGVESQAASGFAEGFHARKVVFG